jgi:transcription elongation factor GreA
LERVPITREGYEALKKELEHIQKVERPRNIKAIEEARAHGDITENAVFDAAKVRQGFLVGKLNVLG